MDFHGNCESSRGVAILGLSFAASTSPTHRPHIARTSPTHRPHIAHWKNTVIFEFRTNERIQHGVCNSCEYQFSFLPCFYSGRCVGDVWAMCGRCVGDVWAMWLLRNRASKLRPLSRIRNFHENPSNNAQLSRSTCGSRNSATIGES